MNEEFYKMAAYKLKMPVNIFKTLYSVFFPVFATKYSACFDIEYQNPRYQDISGYDKLNKAVTRFINKETGNFEILPGDRLLVPTGLIFDLPEGYSLRLHPRSGLALKKGIVLANCEGVVDNDYVEPVFAILTNISERVMLIEHRERICQGELVKDENYIKFAMIKVKPVPKSERVGGFGSTGDKPLDENVDSEKENQEPVTITEQLDAELLEEEKQEQPKPKKKGINK